MRNSGQQKDQQFSDAWDWTEQDPQRLRESYTRLTGTEAAFRTLDLIKFSCSTIPGAVRGLENSAFPERHL